MYSYGEVQLLIAKALIAFEASQTTRTNEAQEAKASKLEEPKEEEKVETEVAQQAAPVEPPPPPASQRHPDRQGPGHFPIPLRIMVWTSCYLAMFSCGGMGLKCYMLQLPIPILNFQGSLPNFEVPIVN